MKRILILLIVLAAGALSAAAQEFEGLKMESYEFSRIHPYGLRGVTGTIRFVMNNTGDRREISQVKVTIFKAGKAFLQATSKGLVFERGRAEYEVSGKVKLARTVNVFEAVAALTNFDPALYTANLSARMVREDGTEELISRENVPVTHFMPAKAAASETDGK